MRAVIFNRVEFIYRPLARIVNKSLLPFTFYLLPPGKTVNNDLCKKSIQGQREMMEFTYDDVLANLVKIQLFNRLGENEYYIAIDDWRSHFDAVLDAAKEVAPEVCMTNECRGWSGQFEPEGLWQETEAILGFTYSKEEAEIDRALRSKWSYYTFFPY